LSKVKKKVVVLPAPENISCSANPTPPHYCGFDYASIDFLIHPILAAERPSTWKPDSQPSAVNTLFCFVSVNTLSAAAFRGVTLVKEDSLGTALSRCISPRLVPRQEVI
jgi:hypothetical protein